MNAKPSRPLIKGWRGYFAWMLLGWVVGGVADFVIVHVMHERDYFDGSVTTALAVKGVASLFFSLGPLLMWRRKGLDAFLAWHPLAPFVLWFLPAGVSWITLLIVLINLALRWITTGR
jgi:hypothetical protein